MRYPRVTVTARQGADGSFDPSLTEAVNWSGDGWEALPPTLFSFTGYDSRGNAMLAVDPNGNSVITVFDGASRAIEVDQLQRVNGQGNQPPPGSQSFLPGGRGLVRTQSVFDGNGNLVTLIDSNGNETSYTYDLLDRQVMMTFQDGSFRSNAYDLASDVTTYVDENGSSFASTFDPLGRKTAVAITRATGVVGTTSQAFQYDGLSRMTECQDVNSDTSATAQNDFYFDSLGRVLEERAIAFGNTRYTTHSQFISTVLQQLTYPNDRQTTNTWDLLYRRTEVAESGGSSICQWSFFGPGRLAGFGLGNGLVCTYLNNDNTNSAVQSPSPQNPAWGDSTTDRLGYDGAGRNICKRYIDDDSNLIVGFTTAYDRAGNKAYERPLQAEERASLYLPFNATTNAPGSGYDSLNRLLQYHRGVLSSTGGIGNAGGGQVTTAITLPGTDASRTYNLDDLGNWKTTSYVPEGSSTTTTEVRRHNSTNELTKFGSTSVTYDHGNNAASTDTLVKQRGNGNIVNDGTRIFAYDALNRVTQVNSAASPTTVWAVYTYDALGRRIRKVVTNGGVVSNSALNGTTDYLYDDQQIIEDRDGSNAAIAQYAWGMYIDELIQKKVIGDDDYFLLSDMLYRAAALTDSDGNIVETYDTDAYGNTICYSAAGTGGDWWADDAATTTNPINTTIFTGRQYDAETGIYYYRARYYHPALGRFIGRDPIDFRSNIMLYLYCAGNPSLWVDFTGTDNSGKLTLPEGQQSIIDGEYMLMKACDRCPSTTGCSVQQCKAEVKRLISNLLKAWTDNYGKGPLKGRDPVAGWFCWDWEAAFKDAADNSALTCLSASDGKLAADPNSDGSIPVHYFLEVHVCKGTSNDTQVSFDDGFFDGQNISHEGTFPSPTPPTGYHPVPFVPSPKQIWHPPIRR